VPDDSGADLRLYQLVHRLFRERGHDLVETFRSLDGADRERVARVADVWDFYSRMLRQHHHDEDNVIWPRLKERRPDFAAVEAEMEREHRAVDQDLAAADAGVAAVRRTAADVTKAAEAVAAVSRGLDEHLDHEERVAFPVVHEALSEAEWAKMEKGFLRSTPKADLPYAAAALEECARRVSDAERPPPPPLPVRLALALSWRRKYRRFSEPFRSAS
jgi:hemerythrin-like domain-containing protein